MPNPKRNKEAKDFDGSISQLDTKFVSKMEELFSCLLNPDELETKKVNGVPVTGSELLNYFNAYVKTFNSDEIPRPVDLIEATARAYDYNLIHKLKVRFF